MSYIQNNLMKNEKLLYYSKMHWIVFALPVFMLLATIVLAALAPKLFPGYLPFFRIRLSTLMVLALLVTAIFTGISTFIRRATSEYGITNRRIIFKAGWISRDTLELFLNRIEAIYVDQSVFGRILDYGSIRIVGTGGTQDPLTYIPHPLAFRKAAQEQLDLKLTQ